MSNSINDLLDKNAELTQLIEDAKRREDHSVLEVLSACVSSFTIFVLIIVLHRTKKK